MARELAFVMINPYPITKSRTGGIIARYLARTDLNFVAARMFGPGPELVREYADIVRHAEPVTETNALIADYILRAYAPSAATGKRRRVMLLMFEGEDAVQKIWDVTGSATMKWGSGQTVRDTYGDYILNDDGSVRYFEPAVLVAPTVARAARTLRLWADHSEKDGGLIEDAMDLGDNPDVQRTLVILKPDNFWSRSLRPGSIIDLLSSAGLRIIGVKKFSMTVAQAEEFYGPVKKSLTEKFKEFGVGRVASALTRELGVAVPDACVMDLCDRLGPIFANAQFETIVKFMTGYKPSECPTEDHDVHGKEECLAMVYSGMDAVNKIRALLGTTDPSKALPGSVRHEFGRDIMVNAAHASDSPESAKRELGIIRVGQDSLKPLVDQYYPA